MCAPCRRIPTPSLRWDAGRNSLEHPCVPGVGRAAARMLQTDIAYVPPGIDKMTIVRWGRSCLQGIWSSHLQAAGAWCAGGL